MNENEIKSIVNKYKDSKTNNGHEIKVDENDANLTLWYLKWHDEGHDKYSHIGITQISKEKYEIGYFNNADQKPYKFNKFKNFNEVIEELDRIITNY